MDGLTERLERNLLLERQSAALLRESREMSVSLKDDVTQEGVDGKEEVANNDEEEQAFGCHVEAGNDVDQVDTVDVRRLAMSVLSDDRESFHFGEDDAVMFGENIDERDHHTHLSTQIYKENADDGSEVDPKISKPSSREALRQQQRQQRHIFPHAAAVADKEQAAIESRSAANNDGENDGFLTDELELNSGISPAAAARLHKARADSLARDLAALSSRHSETSRELSELRTTVKELGSSRDKLHRTCRAADTAKEKHAKAEETLRARCDELQKELAQEKTLRSTAQKDLKQLDSEHKSLHVRFTRSTEEVSSLKAQVKELKSSFRDDRDVTQSANTKLVSDIRRLEKEKAELVKAFKQQMKLVDVLKKQRVHIEAAQMLNFTEAEFRKALEKV